MADLRFTLNSGHEIPAIGLGTWKGEPGKLKSSVLFALQHSYKLIDCAYCYGNEKEVGEALTEAFTTGTKREDVFVTSKLWSTYQTSDERVELGLDKSLTALGLDYLDLFLVHWPVAMNPAGNHDTLPTLPNGERDIFYHHSHLQTWKSMERLLTTGKVKAIGVCNYSKRYLEELLSIAEVIPAVNQIENHPSLPQDEIIQFCHEKGIHIMAYSPFGSTGAPVMTTPSVTKIAGNHNVTASTVLLSYHLARRSTVLAKSTSETRIKDNLNTVALDEDDMKALGAYSADLAVRKELKRYVYPPFGVDFGFPDKQ
ncbi:GCY protein [Ilyonectria destructans]|nr:GCY protein [Ilyonectria destructans]